jgi:hypothetical protein
MFEGTPLLGEEDGNIGIALLTAAGLSMMTTLLFGILPALRSVRVGRQQAVQANPTRIANTREEQRARHLRVGGEIACTVVLLIVIGLLVRVFSPSVPGEPACPDRAVGVLKAASHR